MFFFGAWRRKMENKVVEGIRQGGVPDAPPYLVPLPKKPGVALTLAGTLAGPPHPPPTPGGRGVTNLKE